MYLSMAKKQHPQMSLYGNTDAPIYHFGPTSDIRRGRTKFDEGQEFHPRVRHRALVPTLKPVIPNQDSKKGRRKGNYRQKEVGSEGHLDWKCGSARKPLDTPSNVHAYDNVECNQAINQSKGQKNVAKIRRVSDRESHAYRNLNVAYSYPRDFEEAKKFHQQELKSSRELEDKTAELRAIGNLGIVCQQLREFREAECHHKEELNIAQRENDEAAKGRAYGNLGTLYQNQYKFKEALQNHNKELQIALKTGDKAAEGRARGNLGIDYHGLGQYKDAIVEQTESLKTARDLDDKAVEGHILCNSGNVYNSLGRYAETIKQCEQALAIKVKDKAVEGRATAILGNAYAHLGDFTKAKEYHQRQREIAQEVENKFSEAQAYIHLGQDCLNITGCFTKGINYIKEGLRIAKDQGDKGAEGLAYRSLGNAYLQIADFKKAEQYHGDHLMIAQEIEDRQGEGYAYTDLGNVYRGLNDFKRAEVYHEKGRKIAIEVEDKLGEGLSSYSLGLDFESVGSLPDALRYYQTSVDLYDEMRASLQSEHRWKITFREQHKVAYIALWRTLLKLHMTDEALFAAEQGRAQDLVDRLNMHFGVRFTKEHVPVSRIVRDISTQTLFLALEDNKINLWVIKKGNEIRFRQKVIDPSLSLKHLNNNVFTVFKAQNPELKPKVTSLHVLYDAIIGPIEDLLEGDELIIVPDGPLNFVPYGALLNTEENNPKYLSEIFRIRIFPSLTSLKLITDGKDKNPTTGALLVGNPTNALKALPYAEEEVTEIEHIIRTRHSQFHVSSLKNKTATKEAVKEQLKSVALVHIAAHAHVKDGEIELAKKNDSDEENVLTVQDVQNLQLQTRLVVLSCCDTGRGNVTAEGVVGIARAFLCAGARSVVATLWEIDDSATVEFMKHFYQQLVDNKSASEALQSGMKFLRELVDEDPEKREKYGDEKCWAPFVLFGDDAKLEFENTK